MPVGTNERNPSRVANPGFNVNIAVDLARAKQYNGARFADQ
jgi:hypothetical protein